MPVAVMKQVLTHSEFRGWITYIRNKPPSIQEHQLAVISTILVNSNGGKSKHTDFLVSKQVKPTHKEATAFDSFNAAARDFGT